MIHNKANFPSGPDGVLYAQDLEEHRTEASARPKRPGSAMPDTFIKRIILHAPADLHYDNESRTATLRCADCDEELLRFAIAERSTQAYSEN